MTTATASAPRTAASAAVPPWHAPQADSAPWFPAGGVVLLLVLLAAAAAAWCFGPRGLAARRGGRWSLGGGRGGAAPAGDGLDVLCARRLDAHHRIYVVRWSGGEVLLGVAGQAAPVVLDRRPAPPQGGAP